MLAGCGKQTNPTSTDPGTQVPPPAWHLIRTRTEAFAVKDYEDSRKGRVWYLLKVAALR